MCYNRQIACYSRDWFILSVLLFIIAQRWCIQCPRCIIWIFRFARCYDIRFVYWYRGRNTHTVHLPVRFTITTWPIESVYTTSLLRYASMYNIVYNVKLWTSILRGILSYLYAYYIIYIYGSRVLAYTYACVL